MGLFKISCDATLGRHLIATRDLKCGEIILQEPPLIWGPPQITIPVCLGCGNAIKRENFKPCSKCGWPVCSDICEKSPSHIPECQYTVSRGSKVTISTFDTVHPSYQCITVLRCLYQKQFLSEVWKKLEVLQSHCEERKTTPKYERDRENIAQFTLSFFKLRNVFSEEDILRVCGILMVNGHEVPLTTPSHVALYEVASMLEHNCAANCNKTFTDQGSILIKAGVNVKKGDHLSICYTDPLWGTANRRHHLYESKFFWCTCDRCSDPTEFGTNFSAMKCQNSDCSGYLLPPTFLDQSRNGKLQNWVCNKCALTSSSHHVQEILDRVGQDLHEMKKEDSGVAKEFLKNYAKYLHNNHYYLTDVRLALGQLLGHEDDRGLPALTDEDLELKARLCQMVSNLIKTLAPGESRIRGLLLFELHAAVAELGRRSCDPHQLIAVLQESKKLLDEASELLRHQPKRLPEGKIYVQTQKNMKELEMVLKTLHRNIGDSPV
ncbi:SET domain-containing protein SmydA-8-like isoform X2 [Anthonomus grandis grandis]|uniref:SET domain-containing protein SmydA-8-like isoform X2 n=1 Tax=Anthonomus grandis grandis TaxID=2921223 RepID=UPI00216589E2|nr:SET domain-containing protein SmydA-8-like isoform X2 [Anthonomus grandis grandis]